MTLNKHLCWGLNKISQLMSITFGNPFLLKNKMTKPVSHLWIYAEKYDLHHQDLRAPPTSWRYWSNRRKSSPGTYSATEITCRSGCWWSTFSSTSPRCPSQKHRSSWRCWGGRALSGSYIPTSATAAPVHCDPPARCWSEIDLRYPRWLTFGINFRATFAPVSLSTPLNTLPKDPSPMRSKI